MVLEGRSLDRRPSRRGVISDFSDSSRRNLAWAYTQGPWVGMLTLTYPSAELLPRDLTKSHLHTFLLHLTRRGIPYLWIMEFQRRGQVHYHVWVGRNLTDTTDSVTLERRRRCYPWRALMITWLRIIGEVHNPRARSVALHRSSYTEWEVRVGNNYAAKYADKREQKGLPVGIEHYGRWWGVSRDTIQPAYTTEVDEETVSVKTGEVVRAVTIRRQIGRALRAWFPKRKKHKRNPQTGITVALRDEKKAAFLRILAFYLGADPMETQKTKTPDQESWSYRSQRSLARHMQYLREAEKGGGKK